MLGLDSRRMVEASMKGGGEHNCTFTPDDATQDCLLGPKENIEWNGKFLLKSFYNHILKEKIIRDANSSPDFYM